MKHLILDPGHYLAKDNIGIDGVYRESIAVLDTAKEIRQDIKFRGINIKVWLTRENGTDPLDTKARIKKVNDIYNQIKREDPNADIIALSLHTNAGVKGAKGVETYYSYRHKGSGERGEKMAEILVNNVAERTGFYNRGAKTRLLPNKSDDYYYIIRETAPYMVIVEYGFHTNETELKKLSDPNFRNKVLADVTTKSVQEYFNMEIQEPKPPKKEDPKEDIKDKIEPTESLLRLKELGLIKDIPDPNSPITWGEAGTLIAKNIDLLVKEVSEGLNKLNDNLMSLDMEFIEEDDK